MQKSSSEPLSTKRLRNLNFKSYDMFMYQRQLENVAVDLLTIRQKNELLQKNVDALVTVAENEYDWG